MKRRSINKLPVALAAAALARTGGAQDGKAVSLVVGYSAGGSADLIARVVGAELAKRLGRPVVVENIAGASGMLAVQKVLAGPNDGSVIYMGGTDTVVIPMVNTRVKHDWARDFIPIGRMTTVPMVFAVPSDSPYNSLGELIAALRRGGKDHFNYATPGIGTMQHFYAALIAKQAQVSMLHIPYRGGAQIANDLVGKQVNSAVLVLSTAMPFLKDGRIKALSVSDIARVPQLPNVRRIGEEDNFKGMALPLWQGLFVKAGTPAAAVASLEKALLEALSQPELQAKLQEGGISVSPMDGRQLRAFVTLQAAVYRDIATAARISMD